MARAYDPNMKDPDPTYFAQKIEHVVQITDEDNSVHLVKLITTGPGAYITCDCKEYRIRIPGVAAWCKHCEAMIEESLELEMNDFGEVIKLPDRIRVVIQRKPGAEVLVVLQDASAYEDERAYDPTLRTALVELPQPKSEEVVPIGYLRNDEGIRILRDLVLDWLSGYAYDVIECAHPFHATGHRLFSFEDLTENLAGEPLAELVSLLTTKFCLACRQDNEIPDLSESKSPHTRKIRK